MTNIVRITRFRNNLHQICSKLNDWKTNNISFLGAIKPKGLNRILLLNILFLDQLNWLMSINIQYTNQKDILNYRLFLLCLCGEIFSSYILWFQMRMSQEGKRILSKLPKDRTEKEIQYVSCFHNTFSVVLKPIK